MWWSNKVVGLLDKLGDVRGYKRCSTCRHSFLYQTEKWLLYSLSGQLQDTVCSECPKPFTAGRLYETGEPYVMYPANDSALDFEVARRGQSGALFSFGRKCEEKGDMYNDSWNTC